MLRTNNNPSEEEFIRTLLDSYTGYSAAGRSPSDIAMLLARDCMFLTQYQQQQELARQHAMPQAMSPPTVQAAAPPSSHFSMPLYQSYPMYGAPQSVGNGSQGKADGGCGVSLPQQVMMPRSMPGNNASGMPPNGAGKMGMRIISVPNFDDRSSVQGNGVISYQGNSIDCSNHSTDSSRANGDGTTACSSSGNVMCVDVGEPMKVHTHWHGNSS